jgi:D-psicose/D-tagatose/L-ribulose 3-epimerase
MKIGMNMLLWTNHVTEQHYPLIEQLKKTGYQGIEIPLGEGDSAHYAALGKHLSEMQLGVTAVTSLLADTNIASPDSGVRKAGLERLRWAIDMAQCLGAEIICGPIHSAFAYFTRQPASDDEIKWSIENLQLAGDYAQTAGIVLAPEALNRFECYLVNTMEDLGNLLEQVNHPNVGAIYDTHHANIEEKSHQEALLRVAPLLKHVHISENDRGTPGKGLVNWDQIFSTLKEISYDGWLTIESFSTTIPEFANAINVWRNFSSADEVYQFGFDFIKSKWKEA